MNIPTASSTSAFIKTSVSVNGVSVPLNRCSDAILRFCRPAMFHSENKTFDIGPSGSTLFLRYRGRNFGICTQHQFGTGDTRLAAEAFTLVVDGADGAKVGLSPNVATSIAFANEVHRNLADFYLAEFDDVRGDHRLRPHFLELDLRQTPGTVAPERIKLIFAVGFPTKHMDIDFAEDHEQIPTSVNMTLRRFKLYLEMADRVAIDMGNRRPLVLHREHGESLGDPDGLSGAPVFFVHVDASSQAHLDFAGMITDAVFDHRFMLYEADTIRLLLDRYIDGDPAV